jgi:hypothetical protein
MGAKVLGVLRHNKRYELRGIHGRPITAGGARETILANFQIPDEIKRERRRRKTAASSTKSREKEREMAIRSTNEAASALQPAIIAAISRL